MRTRVSCLHLPSHFPQPNQGRPILPEKRLDCWRSHQSIMWLNSSFFFFLLCRERGETVKNLCSEFSRKNVLLNALCLLTSLSCQFFCSAFVVAKDLCASSFVSDPRCQRCPFDVECRPHMRHHLCSSLSAPVDVLVCLHMGEWLRVGVDLCVCFVWVNACMCNYVCVCVCVCDQPPPAPVPAGSRMGVESIAVVLLFLHLMTGNCGSLMLIGSVCVAAFDPRWYHTRVRQTHGLLHVNADARRFQKCIFRAPRSLGAVAPVCHHALNRWPQW